MGRSFHSIHLRMNTNEKMKLEMPSYASVISIAKNWMFVVCDGTIEYRKSAKNLSNLIRVPILLIHYEEQKHLMIEVLQDGRKTGTFLCDNKKVVVKRWNSWKQVFCFKEEEMQAFRYLAKEERGVENWMFLLSHLLGTNLMSMGENERFEKDFKKVNDFIKDCLRRKVIMQVQREGVLAFPTTVRIQEEDLYYGIFRVILALPDHTLSNKISCNMIYNGNVVAIATDPCAKGILTAVCHIKESLCNRFYEREHSKLYCTLEDALVKVEEMNEQIVLKKIASIHKEYRFPKNTKRYKLTLLKDAGIICVQEMIVCILKRTYYKEESEECSYEVCFFNKDLKIVRRKKCKLPSNIDVTFDGFAYSVARDTLYFGQCTYDLRHEIFYRCNHEVSGKVLPVLDGDGNHCICTSSTVTILSPESQVIASCSLKGKIYYVYLNQKGNFCFITSDYVWDEKFVYKDTGFVRIYEVID